jgi:hypothetical protein
MNRTSLSMFARRHRLGLSLLGTMAACAVIIPACSGGGSEDPATSTAVSMTILVTSSPTTGAVLTGATRQFAIQLLDYNNSVVTGWVPAWSIVGSGGIATISASGLATCTAAGTVTVHAIGPTTARGTILTADASLQCVSSVPVPTTMTIVVTSTPATGSVLVAATRQYAIQVLDQNNSVMTGQTATWSVVGTTGIASISSGGLATCAAVGTVTVHAVGPLNGAAVNLTADASLQCAAPVPVPTTMTILVTSTPATGSVVVGATRQFAIDVRDQNNVAITGQNATWSIVGTAGIATISTGGLATCVAVGTVNAHAVGPLNGSGVNLTADASLQCVASAATVVKVVVSPPSANCLLGATMQFSAHAYDINGVEVVGAVSNWLVDASNVGSVSNTGLVTCSGAGTTTVRAFAGSGGNAPGGAASLTVSTSSTIASIHLSVFHAFLTIGGTAPNIQLGATAYNAGGVLIPNVTFVWAGGNTAASVGATGLVTGLANGGALVTASAGGISGTAAISVGSTGAIYAPLVNANGAPAEGAILTATSAGPGGTGITSYSGRGYIPGLNAGTYTVTVALPGYVTQTFTGIVVTAFNATALPSIITMNQ